MTLYERKLLIILSALSIILLLANTYLHLKSEVHLKLAPAQSALLPAGKTPSQ